MKQPKVYIAKLDKILEVKLIDFDNEEIEVYDEDKSIYSYFNFFEVEFMENTGMKDKNGKSIYVGDIVKDDDNIYTIKRSEVYKIVSMCNRKWSIFLDAINCRRIEVIGNIYENKELLKNE